METNLVYTPKEGMPNPKGRKIPIGIGIILFFLGFNFLSTLARVRKEMLLFGPFILNGFPLVLYSIVTAAISGVSFYGILKQKKARALVACGLCGYWYFLKRENTLFSRKLEYRP